MAARRSPRREGRQGKERPQKGMLELELELETQMETSAESGGAVVLRSWTCHQARGKG